MPLRTAPAGYGDYVTAFPAAALAKMATCSSRTRNGSRKRNSNSSNSNSTPHLPLTLMLSQALKCVCAANCFAIHNPLPTTPYTNETAPGKAPPLLAPMCVRICNCFAVESVYTKCAFVVFGSSFDGGESPSRLKNVLFLIKVVGFTPVKKGVAQVHPMATEFDLIALNVSEWRLIFQLCLVLPWPGWKSYLTNA